jgi:hypothetical protein
MRARFRRALGEARIIGKIIASFSWHGKRYLSRDRIRDQETVTVVDRSRIEGRLFPATLLRVCPD